MGMPSKAKTNNRMIGIVTEIFFYSNYVYDLVSEDGLFALNDQVKGRAIEGMRSC